MQLIHRMQILQMSAQQLLSKVGSQRGLVRNHTRTVFYRELTQVCQGNSEHGRRIGDKRIVDLNRTQT